MGNNDASLVEPVDNLRPLDEDGVEVIVKPEKKERSDNSKSHHQQLYQHSEEIVKLVC